MSTEEIIIYDKETDELFLRITSDNLVGAYYQYDDIGHDTYYPGISLSFDFTTQEFAGMMECPDPLKFNPERYLIVGALA